MTIIDSCARPRLAGGAIDCDGLLPEMDRAGIERAVLAPPDEFVCAYNEEGNRQVLEAVKRRPDRFSGMAVANPWLGPAGARMLSAFLQQGLAGLFLHPFRQGFQLTEGILDPLLSVCADRGMPVYSCTGTPVSAMPFQLSELARRFPTVPFVMGHAAWTDFCGYDVVPACLQSPNILVDPSCCTPGIAGSFVTALGAGRLLFCSAFPLSRPAVEADKIRGLSLPPDGERAVFRGNAERLWRVGA